MFYFYKKGILLSFFLVYITFGVYAQEQNSPTEQSKNYGELHGNFQTDVQYYNTDTLIGAPIVPEKVRMNGFANLTYTRSSISAGIRYESYLNALQGFDPRYKGSGIMFRYVDYNKDELHLTAGSFYEQFGNGLILRSYEERSLGFDNVLDGFRVKYTLLKGIRLTGFIAKQRSFFTYGPGIVRGVDADISINELVEKWNDLKTKLFIGGSFVSKYQQDQDPVYKLPENVGAMAGRLKLIRGGFSLNAEYAYKINDPATTNGLIYKPGEAIFVSTAYSRKGFGVTLSAKRIDNMDFRSDRTSTGNNLNINFLPALTRQHTYNLAATIYPYGTQANGEVAFQGDVIYSFKKGSFIGGEYGSTININHSQVFGLDTTKTFDGLGYTSKYESLGQVYFKDFNVEFQRKINSKLKVNLFYANFVYNKDVVQGLHGYSTIYADVFVADVTYKLNKRHAVRTELQNLSTKQDYGSWATVLVEYTVVPNWFFAVMDQYNYGNPIAAKRLHYPIGIIGYIKNATRIQLSYGRQRAGIFCVGGVCRNVPASNGLTLTLSSSF